MFWFIMLGIISSNFSHRFINWMTFKLRLKIVKRIVTKIQTKMFLFRNVTRLRLLLQVLLATTPNTWRRRKSCKWRSCSGRFRKSGRHIRWKRIYVFISKRFFSWTEISSTTEQSNGLAHFYYICEFRQMIMSLILRLYNSYVIHDISYTCAPYFSSPVFSIPCNSSDRLLD